MSKADRLTTVEEAFLSPSGVAHRQYEALRAYFVEKLPSKDAAAKFGYTPGSFRVLCHQFRQDPKKPFFLNQREHPGSERSSASSGSSLRDKVVALRKRNHSIYDISRVLADEQERLSAPAIWSILHQEGFARLPRRRDEERPVTARPATASIADVRQFDLSPREFRTEFGGLSVFDEGLALFAGLNVIPKRSLLTEYSCRIEPSCYPKLMQRWFDAMSRLGLERGDSFHLDFHTIPFHGEDALVEKHYVSKRSRRQKGVLAFLAQDANRRFFCYANADLRKQDQNDEILRFVEFWKRRTGSLPKELIFDSKLTTYANLNSLNEMGIRFITLRRRTEKLLAQLENAPSSAWRRIELKSVSRAYRTPRVLDQRIGLEDYDGELRQIAITELGHEQPTLLLTNQLRRSAPDLIGHYAKRMLIENTISDSIDFFHMDALSSAVALKVNCDLQLTLMGSSLYRMLGVRIGGPYATAESRHIFRDFVEASARVAISNGSVHVQFGKRAHNPLLLAAGFADSELAVPWWGGRRLMLSFG